MFLSVYVVQKIKLRHYPKINDFLLSGKNTAMKMIVEKNDLSLIQKRIWQLHKDGRMPYATGVVEINGTICHERLQKAVSEVINRHEILRTCYKYTGNEFPEGILCTPEYSYINVHPGN